MTAPNAAMPWWRVSFVAIVAVCPILVGIWYESISAIYTNGVYDKVRHVAPMSFWGALFIIGGTMLLASLIARRAWLSAACGVLGSFEIFWALMVAAAAPANHGTGLVGATLFLTLAALTWLCSVAVSGVR